MTPKTGAIIQARLNSTRLCHKVLRDIHGHPMLWWICRAAWLAKTVECTTVTTPDAGIADLGWMGIIPHLWEGPRDPLGEYASAARQADVGLIIRLTGDCPMVTGAIIDETVRRHLDKMPAVRYTYNQCDGADVEVFDFGALSQANREAGPEEREHVTTWIRRSLPCQYLDPPAGEFRSVNTMEDLELVRRLMGKD